jgi:hypothetical protein
MKRGLIVERYNTNRYVVSETLDADGPAPIVFAYNLDPVSNASIGATMSCVGPSGQVRRTVPIGPRDPRREGRAGPRELPPSEMT